MSSQPSGSTVTILDSGKRQRDPGGEAAAAAGNEDQGGRGAELLADLDPDAPLPFDDVDVVEGGDEGRAALVGEPGGDLLAALGERGRRR